MIRTRSSLDPTVSQDTVPEHRLDQGLFPLDPKAYLLGHFDPDTTADFVLLPPRVTDGSRLYLRTPAARGLEKMIAAANRENISMVAVSAMRTFARQRAIWDSRFSGTQRSQGRNLAEAIPNPAARCLAVLEYSSAPGASRHHWGTEVDLVSTDLGRWQTPEGAKTLSWLEEHASRFGFVMAYPSGRNRGHAYEPWHWSYRPLARPMLRNHYQRLVRAEDITGFLGAEHLGEIPLIEWYVFGVNEALR